MFIKIIVLSLIVFTERIRASINDHEVNVVAEIPNEVFVKDDTGDETIEAKTAERDPNITDDTEEEQDTVQSLTNMFELSSMFAGKQITGTKKPNEETRQLYTGLASLLNDIIELCKNTTNAEDFLKSGGVRKTIAPNLIVPYAPMRRKTLVLLKMLFENDKTTTEANTPPQIADKLVKIFEHDKNVAHKSFVLDILNVWLPGNPKIQDRIMRINGIDIFYGQISKLDHGTVYSMLNLFNKLLVEHKSAINSTNQTVEAGDLVLYRQMGFIQKMSTAKSCDGLLAVFRLIWNSKSKDDDVFTHILELLKNFKDLCLARYKLQDKAVVFFEEMTKHVMDAELSGNKNATYVKDVLNDLLASMNVVPREEL